MKVIAVSGFKRSGKDTLAEHLVSKGGYRRVAFADPLKDMTSEEYDIPREWMDNPKFKENPLLTLPVIPKDDFTLNLSKMLYKEFRTETGLQVPEYQVDASGAFVGLLPTKGIMTLDVEPVQLYWTPRALCILKGSVNRAVRSDYWVQAAIDKINNPVWIEKNYGASGGNRTYVIPDLRYRSEVEQLKQAFGKELLTVRVNRFDSVNSTDPSENDLNNHKFDIIIDNKGTLEEFLQKVEKLV